jgi:hypothetical protein
MLQTCTGNHFFISIHTHAQMEHKVSTLEGISRVVCGYNIRREERMSMLSSAVANTKAPPGLPVHIIFDYIQLVPTVYHDEDDEHRVFQPLKKARASLDEITWTVSDSGEMDFT